MKAIISMIVVSTFFQLNLIGQSLLDKKLTFNTSELTEVIWGKEGSFPKEKSRNSTNKNCFIQINKEYISIQCGNENYEYDIISKKYSDIMEAYIYVTEEHRFQFMENWYFGMKPSNFISMNSYSEFLYKPIENLEIK